MKRNIRRISLWSTGIAAVIAALLTVVFIWLMFTTAGARFGLHLLSQALPIELQYQAISGRLAGKLRLSELRVTATDDTLGFQQASVERFLFRWQPTALFARHLYISELALEDVRIVLLPPTESESAFKLPTFSAPLPITVAALRSRHFEIEDHNGQRSALPDLSLGVTLLRERLKFSNVQVDYQQQRYTGSAVIRFAQPLTFSIENHSFGTIKLTGECTDQPGLECNGEVIWKALQLPFKDVVNTPSGTVSFALKENQLTTDATLHLTSEWLETDVELAAEADLNKQTLKVNRLFAPLLGGTLDAKAQASWGESIQVSGTTKLEGIGLKPWLPEQYADAELSMHNRYQLQQVDNQLSLSTHNEITELRLGEKPISGNIDLTFGNNELQLQRLQLGSSRGRLEATGNYHLEKNTFAASLDANSLALEYLLPNCAGMLDANVALAGSVSSPNLKLDLSSEQLSCEQVSVSALALRADLSTGATPSASSDINAMLAALKLNTLKFSSAATTLGQQQWGPTELSLAGTLDKHKLQLRAENLADIASINVLSLEGHTALPDDLANNWEALAWQAQVNSFNATLLEPPLGEPITLNSPFTLRIAADTSYVDAFCLSAAEAELCLNQARYTKAGELGLKLSLAGIQLEKGQQLFPQYFQKIPENWLMEGEIKARFAVDAAVKPSDFSIQQLTTKARAEIEGLRFQYRVADNDVEKDYRFEQFWLELSGDENKFAISGTTAFNNADNLDLKGEIINWQQDNRAIDLALRGKIDSLQFLQPFFPGFQELSGKLRTDLRLIKNNEHPSAIVTGELTASELGFNLLETGTQVKNWQARISATEKRIDLSAEGNVGDGEASVKGKIEATELNSAVPFSADLDVQGKKLVLVNLPDKHFQASPSLSLKGEGLRWHLSGDVRVSDSALTIREIPASAVKVSEDARVYGKETEEKQSPLQFTSDIQLIAGKNIRFTGFGLTTDITGRLHYTRDLNSANQLQGVLSLPKGSFKQFGQELTINDGKIIFSGPINNPAFDVRAARTIDTILVGVWLHGTARRPKTALYSSPSMSEANVLSYLLTGRPMGKSEGDESEYLESAALAMGINQAMPALQEIGNQLGLSDVSVETGPLGGGGSVAAGKRLNDKLYVKYQYGLVGAVGRFVIEYELTDRLKLEAGSGETNSLDITYTWDSDPPANSPTSDTTAKDEEDK